MNDSQESSPGGNASKPSFGLAFMIIGAVVAFFPVVIAIANTAPGHNWMSEGDEQSGGTALWFFMFTFPLGGIIGIFGLVKFIQAANKSSANSNSAKIPATAPDLSVYAAPNKRSRTLGTVVAIGGGALFGVQGLLMLTESQGQPSLVIQGIVYLAIGLGIVIFGLRRAKQE